MMRITTEERPDEHVLKQVNLNQITFSFVVLECTFMDSFLRSLAFT